MKILPGGNTADKEAVWNGKRCFQASYCGAFTGRKAV